MLGVGNTPAVSRHDSASAEIKGQRRLYLFACTALACGAFAFNWLTGHRGIFFLDQSMIFDGGWRILIGQIPYTDFWIPFGPITFYIQALFFWLFGVNWSATVLPACIFNTIAALTVVRIVRILTGLRALALLAGVFTAICFQAPFGTLWLEQTALFFNLLSLQAIIESLSAGSRGKTIWQVLSGCCLALAILSKQNYGVFFVPIILAVILAGQLGNIRQALRDITWMGAGFAASIGAFLAWIFVFSDLAMFVQRYLVVAAQIGKGRLSPGTLLTALSFSMVPNLFQPDLIGLAAGLAVLFLAGLAIKAPAWRPLVPLCAVAILLPLYRTLYLITTLNEWKNGLAFEGLAACLGIGIIWRLSQMFFIGSMPGGDARLPLSSPRTRAGVLLTAAILWIGFTMLFQAKAAWTRFVQQFEGATFAETVDVPGLERVRWGEPTLTGLLETKKTLLKKADFENLMTHLTRQPGNFFVMGDSTILYGLLGVAPPQPLLYFLADHSFLTSEIPKIDPLILASLQAHKVDTIILEKKGALVTPEEVFRKFPQIWAWFEANFDYGAGFGNYEVWRQRSSSLP